MVRSLFALCLSASPRRIGDALGLGSANNSLQTIQSLENAIDADTKTKAKSKAF